MTTVGQRHSTENYRRMAKFAGGFVLIGLAVWWGSSGADLAALTDVSGWALLGIAAGVAANLGLTSLLFWVVTRSFDARLGIGFVKMGRLIAASSLLNYLPLKPGLIGRAIYLKSHHGLSLRQSALIWLIVMAVTAGVFGVLGAVAILVRSDQFAHGVGVSMASLALLSMVAAPLARGLLKRPVVAGWSWVLIKLADLLAEAARLWLAMSIVGPAIGYVDVIAASAAGMVVRLIGLTPNGLGVREWAIAGVLQSLAGVGSSQAVLAALIDRAVEVLILVPLGLWSIHGLSRTRPLDSERIDPVLEEEVKDQTHVETKS